MPLAGITTVRQIRENAFDIKATGRLNRLYVELLKENPDWDAAERREAFNHFMARLIFCFFAEDTNIFPSEGLFTHIIQQMSASDSSNTHEVLSELFRAMSTPHKEREAAQIRNWVNRISYVNGGLFAGDIDVPRFSKIARSYLLHVGSLDWTKINPDIFGSMIQAVADDEERGALGMHYTSVPNILKVLNPLFLDDLRAQLESAEDNPRKLLNLRQRMARIRVFDPACGSGNFLVIAYKEMRAIEAEINRRRREPDASEAAVTEAVNDTLKAIAASLLMEQVLAPRFEFQPKKPNNQPTPGFYYGEGGYDSSQCNVGFNPETGQIQLEINGLATPKSPEAQRICREDLTELVTAFVQDKTAIERGLFDEELVPEELTQVCMGKIIKEKLPNLNEEDQEAVRQHAIAALNLIQQAKKAMDEKPMDTGSGDVVDTGEGAAARNTALIHGVRQFALSVTELDIDLIDRINPFGGAYAILAKSMSEERLKQVAAVIAAKRVNLTIEEARDLAKRALRFKQEKGRLPSLTAVDPWEKRMAEGVAFLQRKSQEDKNA